MALYIPQKFSIRRGFCMSDRKLLDPTTYVIFKDAQKLRSSAVLIFLQPRCFYYFMSEYQPALFVTNLDLRF